MIGLKFIQQYPQLVHAYIGCGQVVNMQKSSQMAYDFALTKNMTAKNQKNVDRLKAITPTYESNAWLDDLLFVAKQVVKLGGSLYGKSNYNGFVWDFITSDKYSLKDLLNREKGSLQSIQRLWQELMTVNFEDDVTLGVGLRFDLEAEHYLVSLAGTAVHALAELAKETYHLIILDVNSPDGNGFSLCGKMKKVQDIPVIFLTACDLETDQMRGFDVGADDYITKPFSMPLLRKRVAAVLKRSEKQEQKQYYNNGHLLLCSCGRGGAVSGN